eukprot:4559702-Heterocapsa_arctica.AAC.1
MEVKKIAQLGSPAQGGAAITYVKRTGSSWPGARRAGRGSPTGLELGRIQGKRKTTMKGSAPQEGTRSRDTTMNGCRRTASGKASHATPGTTTEACRGKEAAEEGEVAKEEEREMGAGRDVRDGRTPWKSEAAAKTSMTPGGST